MLLSFFFVQYLYCVAESLHCKNVLKTFNRFVDSVFYNGALFLSR